MLSYFYILNHNLQVTVNSVFFLLLGKRPKTTMFKLDKRKETCRT